MVALFVLLVVAVVLWRVRPAPPLRADVGASRRVGGRLVSVAGFAALGFVVLAIAGSGAGGYAFFVFLSFYTFPPVAAAIACARAGTRLARNVPASRVTAAVSGGALTLCATFWTWFWSALDVGDNIVDGSRTLIDVEAGLIATIGLVAVVGTALVVGPAREPAGTSGELPSALPAARRVQRWEVAAAFIAAGLVATVTVGLGTATAARSVTVHVKGSTESNAADCRDLFATAAHDLSSLDYGSPAPPRIDGATVVGAAIVPPEGLGAPGAPYVPGRSAMPDSGTPGLIVMERVHAHHPIELAEPARRAVVAAGLTPNDRPNITAVNDDIDSLTLPYQGQGVHGAISYLKCGDESYAAVVQEVRPDRVGVCRDHTDACAQMWGDGGGPLALVDQAFVIAGSGKIDYPAFSLDGGMLVLSGSADVDDSPFISSMDIDNAMRGWQDVRLTCDGQSCFDHSMMGVNQTGVGVYRKSGVTATLTLTKLGEHGSHLVVRLTRPI